MSYDVWLEVWSGPGEVISALWANYTSNTAAMWRAAGCDLAAFDGHPATELAAALTPAIEELRSNPDRYRAMEPPNGWGDLPGTIEFLSEIAEACNKHLFAVVRVNY